MLYAFTAGVRQFCSLFLNVIFGMVGSMGIDPSLLDSETMTLTARQFEAVRTRVNTLTATMRRRMEQATRKDVREVFSSEPLSPKQVGIIV